MLYLFLAFVFTVAVLITVIYWQVQLIKKLSELAARITQFEVQPMAPSEEALGTTEKKEEVEDEIPLEDMSPHNRARVIRGLKPEDEKPSES